MNRSDFLFTYNEIMEYLFGLCREAYDPKKTPDGLRKKLDQIADRICAIVDDRVHTDDAAEVTRLIVIMVNTYGMALGACAVKLNPEYNARWEAHLAACTNALVGEMRNHHLPWETKTLTN